MNKHRAIRYLASIIFLLMTAAAIFAWWAVGTSLPKHSKLPVEQIAEANPVLPPAELKISSYNIGHGQGIKENPWDYRDKDITLRQLSLVADAIARIDADILLLQEVDLDSRRTFHMNQLEFIKRKAEYPYHACALLWEKNYVPFPYWPIGHHIGYVRAANCILSKFPLSNHERVVFDKPESNPFWYNWGYIDYALERVNVAVGSKTLVVINVHLDAFDKAAREKQIGVVENYVKDIDLPVILGGDFNTVPPDAKKQNGFPDSIHDDYQNERTLRWFESNAKDLKAPALSNNTDSEPCKLCTYPSNQPNRQLDHIFLLGGSLSFVDFWVDSLAKTASDHLPVVAKIGYQ